MKKIDLVEKISTLDEFREMSKKGIYPLVVVLIREEFNSYEHELDNEDLTKGLQKTKRILDYYYYHSFYIKNRDSRVYMFIDSDKLCDLSLIGKIQIHSYTNHNREKSYYSKGVYPSYLYSEETLIDLVNNYEIVLPFEPERLVINSNI